MAPRLREFAEETCGVFQRRFQNTRADPLAHLGNAGRNGCSRVQRRNGATEAAGARTLLGFSGSQPRTRKLGVSYQGMYPMPLGERLWRKDRA
jgi:hypothetical protein